MSFKLFERMGVYFGRSLHVELTCRTVKFSQCKTLKFTVADHVNSSCNISNGQTKYNNNCKLTSTIYIDNTIISNKLVFSNVGVFYCLN